MENNRTSQPINKRQRFSRFMRYLSVAVVTVWLLVFLIASVDKDDFRAVGVIVFLFFVFLFIIPLIEFWIYSFVKAVRRHSKADKILLWFHIADLLILGGIVYLLNSPPMRCDAFIMAECYNGEPVFWMWNTVNRYRNMLPDSTRLVVEFDNGDMPQSMPQSDILGEFELKKLKESLDYLGCIGIDVNNYPDSEYSTIRFRRINMGMYSYRLYNHPLSYDQQDSINADPCLIVYNDSTVFEFSAGVLGAQTFPGKQEFIEAQKRRENR